MKTAGAQCAGHVPDGHAERPAGAGGSVSGRRGSYFSITEPWSSQVSPLNTPSHMASSGA
jgi:hypothetical protein